MKKKFLISLAFCVIFNALRGMENNDQRLSKFKGNIQTLANKDAILKIIDNTNQIVVFLQEKGARIGRINNCGLDLLCVAAQDGSIESVVKLLETIIVAESIQCIKELNNHAINIPDANQKTLLMHTINENNKKILSLLLKKGASISICDQEQKNALHLAGHKNPLLIKTILKHFIVPGLDEKIDIIKQKIDYLKNNVLFHDDSSGQKPYEIINSLKYPDIKTILNPENSQTLEDFLK